jgi:large subunit ribosomal protein L3
MKGLIGKKVGMTSVFGEGGAIVPCTVIEVGPCVVTQVKTVEKDGYESVQLGFGDKKEKNTSKAMKGHFTKSSTAPKSKLVEFRGPVEGVNVGDVLTAELLKEGEKIYVTGTSKGLLYAVPRHERDAHGRPHGR